MTSELISDRPMSTATCIIPQPYEEIGLSTKQIHDMNDFRRPVLVYKRDFVITTNVTKTTKIK
jgi:hypothetical protein